MHVLYQLEEDYLNMPFSAYAKLNALGWEVYWRRGDLFKRRSLFKT